ncbi:MAG: hypothetical protein L3J46_00805 [Kangiellaceae bacterium]|nr:hypothetical protein [Kangiellaceae bacterium]
MKTSTKIILSIIVVIIGSILMQVVDEILGGGKFLVSGAIAFVLIYLWTRPNNLTEDPDDHV